MTGYVQPEPRATARVFAVKSGFVRGHRSRLDVLSVGILEHRERARRPGAARPPNSQRLREAAARFQLVAISCVDTARQGALYARSTVW